jgi:hypothetical protein
MPPGTTRIGSGRQPETDVEGITGSAKLRSGRRRGVVVVEGESESEFASMSTTTHGLRLVPEESNAGESAVD